MAVKNYYIPLNVLVSSKSTIGSFGTGIVNALDLNAHILSLLEDAETEFDSLSTDVLSEKTAGSGVTIDGVLIKDNTVDVNGTADAIILDADADTTISSPTDDQIDIEINGADDFTFTANTFTALSGSSIATNTIVETTAASGVTIDSVLLKDGTVVLADGAVGALAIKLGADANNGFYGVSDTQLGVAVEGTLVGGFNTNGLFVGQIDELVATSGVSIDGLIIKDGVAGGATTATATADGLETGALAAGSQFVVVTSDDANKIISLPAPIPGTIVRLINGATGYELRTSTPATIAINGGAEANAESAIAANTYVEMMCVSATAWIGRQYDTAGVQSAVQVAAAA